MIDYKFHAQIFLTLLTTQILAYNWIIMRDHPFLYIGMTLDICNTSGKKSSFYHTIYANGLMITNLMDLKIVFDIPS